MVPATLCGGGYVKVLIVDDDLGVADVIAELLEDLGCHVEIRDGVWPALNRVAAGRPLNLILSDSRMPGDRNGVDLAREVMRPTQGCKSFW